MNREINSETNVTVILFLSATKKLCLVKSTAKLSSEKLFGNMLKLPLSSDADLNAKVNIQ